MEQGEKHARSYDDKDRYDKAIRCYSAAIQLEPKYVAAYNARGKIYKSMGLDEKAIEDHTKAIELDAKYVEGYYSRGEVYLYGKTKDYDKAIKDFTEVIRLVPDYQTAYAQRGEAYAGKKEFTKALEDYAEALRLDSTEKHFRDINRKSYLAAIKAINDKIGTPEARADNTKLTRMDLRRTVEKKIITIEAQIPDADKTDAENTKLNAQTRREHQKRIDELEEQARNLFKNNEKVKAAAVTAQALVIEGFLRDGTYKKDTESGAKLRKELADLKKQLVDLKDDK